VDGVTQVDAATRALLPAIACPGWCVHDIPLFVQPA
jgi:hypothetical protein